MEAVIDFVFLGSKISVDSDCTHEIKEDTCKKKKKKKTLAPWKESFDKPGQCLKKQRHHIADKGPYSQSYSFSSSRVQTCMLDHKES